MTRRASKNLNIAKEKSEKGIMKTVDWLSVVINKATGYDEITAMEKHVNESERRFEATTKKLREVNTEYLVCLLYPYHR